MRRTVLGLMVAAGLGLTGYLWAGDGAGDGKECHGAKEAKAGGCSSAGGCAASAAVAENVSYKRANELLKSWQEAPVKLASMTDADKAELQAIAHKLQEVHPAAQVFHPTLTFLHDGLATVTQIDTLTGQLCAAAVTTRPALAEARPEGQGCPKTAAAFASAKSKMKQSKLLTAKANELILAAYQAGSQGHRSIQGECTESGAKVVLASDQGKAEGGCCADKADKKTKATLTAAGDGAADKAPGTGCCAAAKAAATASEDQPSAKTLIARSQTIVADSGQLLAQWESVGIHLVSMDSADRETAEKAATAAMSLCPIGSRMPETMSTVAALLRDAAGLNDQALAECSRNPGVAQMIPAESRELAETRGLVLSALINVLEKSNGAMKPARQIVSAQ